MECPFCHSLIVLIRGNNYQCAKCGSELSEESKVGAKNALEAPNCSLPKTTRKVRPKATKDDIDALIAFSLTENGISAAIAAFQMFSEYQISQLYSLDVAVRRALLNLRNDKLLELEMNNVFTQERSRNPEQKQKMAEIATDPSNR